MKWDTDRMMSDYVSCCKQKLELFNILMKVDIGWIKREDLTLPVGLIEKNYKALDEYSKVLGLSLSLLGEKLPDIK